ncbi:adenine-specific DNA methyltransferase [Mycoplasmopsis citelli]|uniref:site-specific DNA-methyltransferase (adenine-specific) n=1 Tax=Mycoplasmopsis citelli TaxID=171281 RepID=A0A449B179_9BACT|nr:helix-turn-helix transcriptional regulator [Mycoplasmopsis citelli]VEU74336.1 adenine-specific DNA methyltransferase [Mycoplasmopsis citelli]
MEIDRTNISKIEQGQINITIDKIEKIKKALSIEISKSFQDNQIKPFIKWAGGKAQILEHLKTYMPKSFDHYYETFVGGGAFFFEIAPFKATINDLNKELMLAYNCFQNQETF